MAAIPADEDDDGPAGAENGGSPDGAGDNGTETGGAKGGGPGAEGI